MKLISNFKKSLSMFFLSFSLMFATSVYAELPPAVTTQIDTTRADIIEAGGLIIALAVVAMGIRWVKATFF